MTKTTNIDEAWADGTATVRPDESIVFQGKATGIKTDVEFIFHNNGDERRPWFYTRGSIEGYADKQTRILALKHVEMALIDAGYEIAPQAAASDYESKS